MHIDGIILKTIPFREYDQLVIVWSMQRGRMSLIARSSLRATSKQGCVLDVGNFISCIAVTGRGDVPLMTAAQTQRCWSMAKSHTDRWMVGQCLLHLYESVTYDEGPDRTLWGILLEALQALDAGIVPAMDLFRHTQRLFLEALGYGSQPVVTVEPVRTVLDARIEQIAQRRMVAIDTLYLMANQRKA